MKVQVTQKGIYDSRGQEVPVGTVLLCDDPMPASLINKVSIIAEEPSDPVELTNPGTHKNTPPAGLSADPHQPHGPDADGAPAASSGAAATSSAPTLTPPGADAPKTSAKGA